MSNNPYGTTPQGEPAQQPRRMGTGAKVLLIFGILFVAVAVLCCGAAGLSFLWFRNAVVTSPAAMKETAQTIAHVRVPEPLQPVFALNLKIPFTDKTITSIVGYSDNASGSSLTLMGLGEAFQGQSATQMQQSMEQAMRQQGLNQGQREPIEDGKTSTKEVKINGQAAKFTIVVGRGTKTHAPRIEVTGVFHGRCGPAFLLLDANVEKISREKAEAMLDSIR